MCILPYHLFACGHLPALLLIKCFRWVAECTLCPSRSARPYICSAQVPDLTLGPSNSLGRPPLSRYPRLGPYRTGAPQTANPAATKHLGKPCSAIARSHLVECPQAQSACFRCRRITYWTAGDSKRTQAAQSATSWLAGSTMSRRHDVARVSRHCRMGRHDVARVSRHCRITRILTTV